MNRMFALIVLLSSSMSTPALAQMESTIETRATDSGYAAPDQYRTFVRMSVTAGVAFRDIGTGGTTEAPPRGATGSVLFDLGRGWFTVETGAMFLQTPSSIRFANTNPKAADQKEEFTAQYVGLPVLLKLNVIERRAAAFSVKLGAMPSLLLDNADPIVARDGSNRSLTLPNRETMALAGFTGVAPISRTMGFVIDGTYYRGLTKLDARGSVNDGIAVQLGVRTSL